MSIRNKNVSCNQGRRMIVDWQKDVAFQTKQRRLHLTQFHGSLFDVFADISYNLGNAVVSTVQGV